MPYSVALVIDPNFGPELAALGARQHVWVCRSPLNDPIVAAFHAQHPDPSVEYGFTTFAIADGTLDQDGLLRVIADIDLHHGIYSHEPPWDTLDIYGAEMTPDLRQALAEFGVNRVLPIERGVRCVRSTAGAV